MNLNQVWYFFHIIFLNLNFLIIKGIDSPILIKNNIFRRNFAIKFGLSIVIANSESDYYYMYKNKKCSGIFISLIKK